ncbi:DNA polymerase II large subunit [Paenibacillus sp. DS2015]|uniref:hypothetical protein n=1 Tax=Paenibacillus sp. DS2015 TaxID=3373917 RepID=UPI003D1D78F9
MMQISKQVLEPEQFIRKARGSKKGSMLKFSENSKFMEEDYELLDYMLTRICSHEKNLTMFFDMSDLSAYLNQKFDKNFDIAEIKGFINKISKGIFDGKENGLDFFYRIVSKKQLYPLDDKVEIQFSDEVYTQFYSVMRN